LDNNNNFKQILYHTYLTITVDFFNLTSVTVKKMSEFKGGKYAILMDRLSNNIHKLNIAHIRTLAKDRTISSKLLISGTKKSNSID